MPQIDDLPEPDQPEVPTEATVSSPAPEGSGVSPMYVSPRAPPLAQSGKHIFLDICSGATRPLSEAVLSLDGDVLSFDILLSSDMDLLNDTSYEQLLRICSSGSVRYGAASPACAHYSRLKLLPGPGPRALRTPDALAGVPGLSSSELLQVQESYMMLFRCITCLTLIYQAGGHVHLEQPPSAMSWLEDCVRQFLRLISAWCVSIAACAFGADWYKSWMFASSMADISELGSTCNHPPGSHISIRGVNATTGEFMSRQTACYPKALASAFAKLILPLLSTTRTDWSWSNRKHLFPLKDLHAPPFSQEDGGGLPSQPDWSLPDRTLPDVFDSLRKRWLDLIVSNKLDRYLVEYFAQPDHSAPPFSEETLALFRPILEDYLRALGHEPDWTVREHQPMHLRILQSLSQIMSDLDISLFPSLEQGVSTGFQQDIPPSHCFPLNDRVVDDTVPLSAHLENWSSADDDLPLTWSLVNEEISKGWVFEFPGTLAEAQQAYPTGISIGRLGIAHSEGRAPRLVVDNTVSGLNPRCQVPERATLPSCKDIIRTFPLRNFQGDHLGFSLDIKAAHKRIVLKEEEQGLVGFSLENRLFFYRVAPFGAVFSAHWWSRLGGFLLRLFHRLIWTVHVALLYVDDFIFFQRASFMPVTATMLCIFSQLLAIPISWGKCELSGCIHWIGWSFNFTAGYIEVPRRKLDKLLQYIREMKRSTRTTRRNLEKLIGLAMWLTQLWPYMRIWIRHWYMDLYSIPATHYSIDLGDWHSLHSCLNDKLVFQQRPQGTAIPVGGQLLSVRHQTINNLQDLNAVRLSEKRIWMRIRDPQSSRRKISTSSMRIFELFETWLSAISPLRPMTPKPYWHGEAAADACASGTSCQIGGFIRTSSGVSWFSEQFTLSDFEQLGLKLSEDLQRHITCFETLAQIGLLFLASRTFPAHRFPICLRTLSDNTGAESGSNKLWSMSYPLCVFLEKLCLLSVTSGMEIDVSHIPGAQNIEADDLSRWNQQDPIPHAFQSCDRVRISLNQIWHIRQTPTLVPSHAVIPWSLPT